MDVDEDEDGVNGSIDAQVMLIAAYDSCNQMVINLRSTKGKKVKNEEGVMNDEVFALALKG